MHRYAAHEQLVAAARARPELWRLLLGLGMIAGFTLACNILFGGVLRGMGPAAFELVAAQGRTPASMLVLLASFGFLALGTALAALQLHGRGFASLIGPAGPVLRDFWKVARALILLSGALLLLPPWGGEEMALRPNIAPGLWALLLPLSLCALLIQVSAEEILFRGYLQQQLAARFAHPAVWMGVPSALFAFGHYLPAEAGDNAVIIALWSGVFGLLMADLTARAGNLGPAIAVHLVNNASSLLIISLPDTLSGLSLFTVPFSVSDPDAIRTWMPVDFATMLVGWLAARVALRR